MFKVKKYVKILRTLTDIALACLALLENVLYSNNWRDFSFMHNISGWRKVKNEKTF